MGISCTVASNTLIYKWSGIVQWIHDRIKQEQRGKQQQQQQRKQQQRFLSEKLTQDATHVLTFLQQQCHRDDDNTVVVVHRSFLCKVEDGGGDTSIVLDLHTMPVNFASVCFVKAVDIARRCLERRLLSILFVEEIAAKVAYLELSNVFTLLDEKVTWVVDDDDGGGGDNSVTTTRKRRPKLMVSTQFDADAFCEAFNNRMHHVVVNEYKVYLQSPQFSIDDDGGANDGVVRGDFVSHLNCMHVRLEPSVLHQNYIIPHSVVNLVCRECLSSPTAAIVTPHGVRYHHFCTILPTNLLYASRSFLISYDLDNGEDRDLSKEHLILSTENVCGFSFYSIAADHPDKSSSVATTTGGGGGKSIKGYRDEAYANLEKFMDLQVSKCEEDKRSSTCQRLKANELRKYLSRISQPLKKVNNDKGEIRNRNYACALAELSVRGFYEKYLRDCQTLYELDLVERQGEPHTSQVAKSADHMRCPMPSQLTVSRDFLERLDAYFKQNQRFKKDKNRNSIQVSILPDEDDDAWLNGWYVSVNAREFCHQLASINYRARSGDRFDLRQRNEVCFSNLFRMFDWSIYKEDIKNVIAISVHERKLRAAPSVVRPSPLPFNATLRLDQFFDRDELTAISLLLVASFHHVCKCEEEYCHLRVTPRPLLVPPRDDDDKEASSSRKRMRDGGELPKR